MNTPSLLSPKHWRVSLITGVVCAAGSYAWYANISYWIGATMFVVGVVAMHLAYAARIIVVLPHIAVLIAALQYVLAAWLNYYLPPTSPLFDIGGMLPFYLSYGGPALLGTLAGWSAATWRLPIAKRVQQKATSGLLLELDALFFLGLLITFLSNILEVRGFQFLVLLLGNLRYVGVFGRMLVKGPGWHWRLGILVTVEVLFAAGGAMFHDLLLWTVWIFAIWLFCFTPPPRTILISLTLGFILLPALQESKWYLRDDTTGDPFSSAEGGFRQAPVARAVVWMGYIVPSVYRTVTFNMNEEFLADTAVRYNQGWIINRVMTIVPEIEPYAKGATLKDSAVAALLPRFLAPDKITSGGRENMLRFAALELNDGTAMNLGYAGEMYANFGLVGGAFGCAGYAFAFGLLFRAFCLRASKRPIWWCLVPYIFYAALKAEDDIAFVLNWTSKACIVAAIICVALPRFRHSLFGRQDLISVADKRPTGSYHSRETAGLRPG